MLVGFGEAEPLDMRYQAEPGNELNLVFELECDRPIIQKTGVFQDQSTIASPETLENSLTLWVTRVA